ncbi:MAG: hypothetical protein M1840_007066 [Geoglossum simile]|nr:MAG: hypothetical protein M1840_007066 [Geoglossum simile]
MVFVDFLPAQVDAASSTNALPFTDSPSWLIWSDVKLFFSVLSYVWTIVTPMYSFGSGKLDEMYPSFNNIVCMALHAILIVLQSLFIITIPLWFLYPLPLNVLAVYVVLFWMANKVIWGWLNGDGKPLTSKVPMDGWEEHDDEKWIFMNGISVGDHWLQSNIDRLAMTFRREVTGIHNLTTGIIFDVIECIIERDFCYHTQDSRRAYRLVKEALQDPTNKKVVLILHSQGAIEGSLAIDWLLADLPQHLFRKLEVYTFGAAANHFNNPTRSDTSTLNLARTLSSLSREERTERVIGHIEHYANGGDFVARWGVLNFAKGMNYRNNRFAGRVFESKVATGHLLCQHYLDFMFRWEEGGVVAEENGFVSSLVDVESDVAVRREDASAKTMLAGETTAPSDSKSTAGEYLEGTLANAKGNQRPVRELSRLWKYRNGMSPTD